MSKVIPRQRLEGDTAQARADRRMAELKAGQRAAPASPPDADAHDDETPVGD